MIRSFSCLYFFSVLCLLSSVFCLPCKAAAASPDTSTSGATRWTLPEREKLTFRVKWMGIPAGEITSEIKGIEEYKGRKVYVIEVRARTIGMCSALYRVDDRYVSYLDIETLETLRHEVHRREGGYKKDAVTEFDHDTMQAHFRSLTDGSQKTYAIPAGVQDTITAAYVARTLPLSSERPLELKIANSEKIYDVYMNVTERSRLAIPRRGVREVLHIRPMGHHNGRRVREGRMTGYVDAGPGHLPYLITIKAPVFTQVTAWLVSQK